MLFSCQQEGEEGRVGERERERERERKKERDEAVKISFFFHVSVGKHVEQAPHPPVGFRVYSLSEISEEHSETRCWSGELRRCGTRLSSLRNTQKPGAG